MLDSAGSEIVVGCRVAEIHLGFGDGTVESITVPVHGCDGFNVGVKWDDESKGGPSWSAEGGGRNAEHLLVIEQPAAAEPAAAETATNAEAQPAVTTIGTSIAPVHEYGARRGCRARL